MKNNKDIHLETAALLYDKDIKDVDENERSIAKAINFGLLYGQKNITIVEHLNKEK